MTNSNKSPAVLESFSGLYAANAARSALRRELSEGGRALDTSTWTDGSGRTLGLRRGPGDLWLVVELTADEALATELAFLDGQAAEFAARAAESQAMSGKWPHRAQMAAFDRAEAARFAAKAAELRASTLTKVA